MQTRRRFWTLDRHSTTINRGQRRGLSPSTGRLVFATACIVHAWCSGIAAPAPLSVTQTVAVSFRRSSQVLLLDARTGASLRTLRASRVPQDLSFATADHRLLVASHSVINSFDLDDSSPTTELKLPGVDRVADTVGYTFATRSRPDGVVALQWSAASPIVWTSRARNHIKSLAVDANGRTLFAGYGRQPGYVAILDAATGTLQRTVTVGHVPTALVVSHDGTTAYAMSNEDGQLTPFKVADGSRRAPTHVGTRPRALAVSPGDRLLYVIDAAKNTLLELDAATHTVQRTLALPGRPYDMALTADGARLVITSPRNKMLIFVDAATLEIVLTQRLRQAPRRVVAALAGNGPPQPTASTPTTPTPTPSAGTADLPTSTFTTSPTALPSLTATQSPTPAQGGVLVGSVFDDTSAQVLANVRVIVRHESAVTYTDSGGRYVVRADPRGAQRNPEVLEFRREGYTRAVRSVAASSRNAQRVRDVRLTPRAAGMDVEADGGTIRIAYGNPGSTTASVELIVPANAAGVGANVSLTGVSPQGLIAPLPIGWSALVGIDLAATAPVGPDARLRVPLSLLAKAQSLVVVAAIWDDTDAAWRGGPPVTVVADSVEVHLPTAPNIQLALVVPDVLPTAPPAAIEGVALQGVPLVPAPADSAIVVTDPPVIVASNNVRADVLTEVHSLAPLPSGMVFNAQLRETYTLSDGRQLFNAPTTQDLTTYQLSPARVALAQASGLGAAFSLQPSRTFDAAELIEGQIAVNVFAPTDTEDLETVDTSGGEIRGTGGLRLLVPPNAARDITVIRLRPAAPEDLPEGIGTRADMLGAVQIESAAADLAATAAYRFDLGISVLDSQHFVIGRVAVHDLHNVLVLVGLGHAENGLVVFDACPAGLPQCLDGLTGSGTYVVLAVPPGAIATGTVHDESAARSGLGVVAQTHCEPPTTTCPQPPAVTSITNTSGRYVLLAPLGATSTMIGRDREHDLAGQVAVTPSRADQVITADIALSATRPQVTQIDPPNHRSNVAAGASITLAFSKAIAATSVTEQSVQLTLTSTAGHQIGATSLSPVAIRRSLSADGRQLLLTPDTPLAPTTLYRLHLDEQVVDRNGHPLVAFESDFTTATTFSAATLPPGALQVSLPDADGHVGVCGGTNLAAPGTEVIATDAASGLAVRVVATTSAGQSDSDACTTYFPERCDVSLPGTFCAVLSASFGDRILVQVHDPLDNVVTLDAGPMRDATTGATVVGPDGGVVTAASDPRYQLLIPEGAFEAATLVTVTPLMLDDFPSTAEATMEFIGGAQLDFGGEAPLRQVDLSVPAPDDVSPEDQFLALRVVNFRGYDELTAVDSAVWDPANAAVVTDPAPFSGITQQGRFGVYRTRECTAFVTGFVAIGSHVQEAYIEGGMFLPFPILTMERTRYAVPVPCNRPATVTLKTLADDGIDFLSLPVSPAKGQYVFGKTFTDDATPPRVIGAQTSIPGDAVDVGHDAEISIPFDEALLDASIEDHAKVFCGDTQLRGTWSQSADGARIFFVPRSDQPLHGLPLASHCRVEIDGVQDRHGNPLAERYVTRFTTFAPSVQHDAAATKVDAMAVDSIGWHAASTDSLGPPDLKQYVAFAEGSAYDADAARGIRVQEVTGAQRRDATIVETAGLDYALRFLPAESLEFANHRTATGPYLMSLDGSGGSADNRRRFGLWHLYDLHHGIDHIEPLLTRVLNQSSDSLERLAALDPTTDIDTLHYLRQIPNDLGVPLAMADLGIGFTYIANAPNIGLEFLQVDGIDLDPLTQGVTGILRGFYHSVATLGPWVIGGRFDGLVITKPGLQRPDAVPAEASPDYVLPAPRLLLTLPKWPVDRNRNGAIEGNELFDLVIANCAANGGPALCVVAFDTTTGTFKPTTFNGVLPLPSDSIPYRAFADPERRLLYLANGGVGLTVIDFQDPSGTLDDSPRDGVDDRVLANIALPTAHGFAVARDVAMDVNTAGHTIAFVAAHEDGWYEVDLGPARMHMRLVRPSATTGSLDRVEASEVRYFNEQPTTLYQPEVQLPGHLSDLYPETVRVTVSAVDRTGTMIQAPGPNFAEPSVNLYLQRIAQTNRYRLPRKPDGSFQQVLVVSNLPLAETGGGLQKLMAERFPGLPFTPVYGGIGAQLQLTADVIGAELKGKVRKIPIEKIDVIVLGIDGLRQDVLYPQQENDVNEPGVDYHVDPQQLRGIGQILGGVPSETGGVKGDLDLHHLRMPHVSAVFPSITLASWASIFTGEPPSRTGILGNEFFTRTPVGGLAHQQLDPMITFSEGAFPRSPDETGNLTPAGGFSSYEQPHALDADQNKKGLLQVPTIFEQLRTEKPAPEDAAWIAELRKRFPLTERCGGELTDGMAVQTFNHYARGASCWLTMTSAQKLAFVSSGGGAPFDEIPGTNVADYIAKISGQPDITTGPAGSSPQDLSQPAPHVRRFPALLGIYLAGLDHEAHDGHGNADGKESRYTDYVRHTLDPIVAKIVSKLRAVDQFYNKLFILTADHGHTQISDDPNELYPCNLELDPIKGNWLTAMESSKKRKRENDENNNLHIWELAKIIAAGTDLQSAFRPRVLVPTDLGGINALDSDGNGPGWTYKAEDATVVAALNGAMAHLYVRPEHKASWSERASEKELGLLVEPLRLFLMNGAQIDISTGKRRFAEVIHPAFAFNAYETLRDGLDELRRLIGSVDLILIRRRASEDYQVYNGLEPSQDPSEVRIATVSLDALSDSRDYVGVVERVRQMNSPERSGDIVLLMRMRTDEAPVTRFTTGVACRGWHASLNRSDSYVPLILAYPGGSYTEIQRLTLDVCAHQRDPALDADSNSRRDCGRNKVVPELIKGWLKREYGS